MLIVLTILATLSGGLLAAIRDNTKDRIENQVLEFVKGPAIRSILEGATNDPIVDRFPIKDGDVERTFFVGVLEEEPRAVTFETSGKGYGGDINVMVAVNLETDEIVGIGVTTQSETPGLGSRTKTDPSFASQFKGMSIKDLFKVKADDGDIDAVSGATKSSRGVCEAVMDASDVYKRLKNEILKKIET